MQYSQRKAKVTTILFTILLFGLFSTYSTAQDPQGPPPQDQEPASRHHLLILLTSSTNWSRGLRSTRIRCWRKFSLLPHIQIRFPTPPSGRMNTII